MIIIGISGKAGTGKDMLANYMIEEFGQQYKMKKYAFADVLKKEIEGKEFELSTRYELPLYPDKDGKWRKLMQRYGDEKRRESLYYFVMRISRQIDEDTKNGLQVAIVSDVRRKNEAMFIKSRGGDIIRIKCPDLPDADWREHVTETELDSFQFDYTVENQMGDLEALRQDARAVFSMIYEDLDLVSFMSRQIAEEELIFPVTKG